MITPQNIQPEVLAAMREWIADCVWPDLEPGEVEALSAAQVIGGVRRHFDGGLDAFMLTMEVAA